MSEVADKQNDFKVLIDNVVYPTRQRPLMMSIRNEEQGVVRSPEYIECPKTARPQVIPVEWEMKGRKATKGDAGKKTRRVTQVWTRIFTKGQYPTCVLFPGRLNDWIYPVNPYEVSDIHKRYSDMAKWIALIGYTIMWFTISIRTGDAELSWQSLWGSGWFPLGMGLMAGGAGWMKHMSKSTDMDQIDLTVQSVNKDQHGSIVYVCRPSHQKTFKELGQWGIEEPEDWYGKFLSHLEQINTFSAEERKAIIGQKTELQNEVTKLQNLMAGNVKMGSTRSDMNSQDNWFNLAKGAITIIGICVIFFIIAKALSGGI